MQNVQILLVIPECDRNVFEAHNRIFVVEISGLRNIFIVHTTFCRECHQRETVNATQTHLMIHRPNVHTPDRVIFK